MDVVVAKDADGRCGCSPGSVDVELGNRFVALKLAKTGATNDGNVHRLYRKEKFGVSSGSGNGSARCKRQPWEGHLLSKVEGSAAIVMRLLENRFRGLDGR